MSRRPLCPPCPPPSLSRTRSNGRSRSSWMTMSGAGASPENFTSADTGPPDTFMKQVSFASTSFGPPGRRKPSATRAGVLCVVNRTPSRVASSSHTIWPTLCRLRAYWSPGFPNPTTSHVSTELTILLDHTHRADHAAHNHTERHRDVPIPADYQHLPLAQTIKVTPLLPPPPPIPHACRSAKRSESLRCGCKFDQAVRSLVVCEEVTPPRSQARPVQPSGARAQPQQAHQHR